MRIIELESVDSTSTYLKNLSEKEKLANFTTVTAGYQTAGRGQMGTKWTSEKGMNLTFSTIAYLSNFHVSSQFYLSMAVSLAVLDALKKYAKADWAVKWPNDILANGKKICGLLIENSVKGIAVKSTIIGVGININQVNFPSNIRNTNSLKLMTQQDFDLKEILIDVLSSIKKNIENLSENNFKNLKEKYYENLFMFNKVVKFESTNESICFAGKIKEISNSGAIAIEMQNKEIKKFNFKEIRLITTN